MHFAWLTVKAVAIFLGLATTAFCVSTIVLAVQNADLENDLQDALDKIDALTADTTSTSTSTITTPTGDPNRPTDDGDTTPGGITTPGGESSPGDGTTASGATTPSAGTTASDATTPSGGTTSTSTAPIYPTLPTGLPDPDAIEWRLPTELRPIKYKLYYEPNLKTGECTGTVSIQFQLNEVTNLIVLHALDLNVHSISILNMMARMRVAVESVTQDDDRQLLLIKLREVLSMNKAYTLSASFDCNLSSLTGSYISNYTDASGNAK